MQKQYENKDRVICQTYSGKKVLFVGIVPENKVLYKNQTEQNTGRFTKKLIIAF